MIKYKLDIVQALADAGYNTNRIRQEKIFGESTLQKFRKQEPFNFANMNKLCFLLNLQPGDLIEYVPDPETD